MVNSLPKDHVNYVVITPVRDEAGHIEKTIKSIVCQKVKPQKWVIVDDGSTDKTGEIADTYAGKYQWIHSLHCENRGFRKPGGGVIEAFYEGYSLVNDLRWDFLVKLDGDLSFDEDYFLKCFTAFASDPKLGIGGGTVCIMKNENLKEESQGDPLFHVRGATKIYRRACWEQISPLKSAPGWDTIDEVKANMYGWKTRTFRDIKLIQLKSTGSADGNWRNWFKNGLANCITGYHPAFMLAKCFKRAFQRPLFLCSIALWAGFCSGYLRGLSQLQEAEVARYLRKQQIRRMLLRPSIYG